VRLIHKQKQSALSLNASTSVTTSTDKLFKTRPSRPRPSNKRSHPVICSVAAYKYFIYSRNRDISKGE